MNARVSPDSRAPMLGMAEFIPMRLLRSSRRRNCAVYPDKDGANLSIMCQVKAFFRGLKIRLLYRHRCRVPPEVRGKRSNQQFISTCLPSACALHLSAFGTGTAQTGQHRQAHECGGWTNPAVSCLFSVKTVQKIPFLKKVQHFLNVGNSNLFKSQNTKSLTEMIYFDIVFPQRFSNMRSEHSQMRMVVRFVGIWGCRFLCRIYIYFPKIF